MLRAVSEALVRLKMEKPSKLVRRGVKCMFAGEDLRCVSGAVNDREALA